MVSARATAIAIVGSDPDLTSNPELRDEIELFVDPDEAESHASFQL